MIDFTSLNGSIITINFMDGSLEIELTTPSQESELAAVPLAKLVEESLGNWSSQNKPIEVKIPP
jgi:hypothetical protein